ncbi:MAG TPA: amidohydrolase [Burkholderiales bacterium]|nr:amidohydrolase [Burkholderiales bacterium]
MTQPDLTKLFKTVGPKVIATRRDLHRHPELGLTEFRTASLVARRLTDLGLELKLGRDAMDSASRVGLPSADELARCFQRARDEGADPEFLPAFEGGHTAVLGILKGAQPGPVVALRVDMDALPILEDDSSVHFPVREGFVSQHRGVMHACGHDSHTAMGLGVAEVLSQMRDQIHGTVKFIFQPAEEGGRGAAPMVKAGVADDVDYLIAIHVGTGVPSRLLRPCVFGHLASAKFDVSFHGHASHAGGRPEEGKNALLGAAQAVMGLYAISRHHTGRSRVNVGVLNAGSGRNVIADTATMLMEVRGENDEIVDYMIRRAEAVLRGAALAQDLEVDIRAVGRTTTAASDPSLAEVVATAAKGIANLSVNVEPHRASGSEDATYFVRRVQERGGLAIIMQIGSDLPSGHHTTKFDIDEADLPPAVEAMSRSIIEIGRQPVRAAKAA